MRWPWSKERAPSPPEAAQVAVPREPAPSPMGWAFLPPVQRTLAQPIATLTAPATFPATLPAWRDPTLSGRLGHVVSDHAPAGVIDAGGLTDTRAPGLPLQRASAGADLTVALAPPPRPTRVQRSASDGTEPTTDQPRATSSVDVAAGPDPAPAVVGDDGGGSDPIGDSDPIDEQPVPGPPAPDVWAHDLPTYDLPHAPSLPHAPAPRPVAVQRSIAPTTRTALTTATAAGLPVAVPRVLDEPPPLLVVARSVTPLDRTAATGAPAAGGPPSVPTTEGTTAGTTIAGTTTPTTPATPAAATAPTLAAGSGTPPVVARSLALPEPADPVAAAAPDPVPLVLASPTEDPDGPAAIAVGPLDDLRGDTEGVGHGVAPAGTPATVDPTSTTSAAAEDPPGSPANSSDSPASSPDFPAPHDTAPLLGGSTPSLAVQRATELGAPTATPTSALPAPAAAPSQRATAPSPRSGGRAGFGAPLGAVPATVSDLPVPEVQRSHTAAAPAATATAATHVPDGGRSVTSPLPAGAEGHTEVDLPTAPPAGLVGHDQVEPPVETDAGTGTPQDRPLAPAPMPVVSRASTTTPLGPMVTSLSRSSALTGPGVPQQTLHVAPARTLLSPPAPAAAPLQRLATTLPAGPSAGGVSTTSTAPAVVVPPRPQQAPPSSALLADPRTGSAEPAPAMPVQRAIAIDDIATSLPSPGTAMPGVAGDAPASLPAGVPGAPGAGLPALPQGLDGAEQTVTASRPASAPGQAEGGDVPSGDQLEALAQRLTQPLLRRLTSQLLLDRERHGTRTDRW